MSASTAKAKREESVGWWKLVVALTFMMVPLSSWVHRQWQPSSAMHSAPSQASQLAPLRPQHIPTVSAWLTAGAKELKRNRGKLYYEVTLGEAFQWPQIGWLTDNFVAQDYDGAGVGDDSHGWASDGERHLRWHAGTEDARWPRDWLPGDVIGCAIDFEAGTMRFSLNGEWVDIATMKFAVEGKKFFPAVSISGYFEMHIPKSTWKFKAPSNDFNAWAESGVFTRPGAEGSAALPAAEFTLAQLETYDGKPESGGEQRLLIAIWGRVFNVTTGSEFYAPGSGYTMFAGKDITRAIALTKVKKSEVNRDLDGLEEKKIAHLNMTYWNTYVYKYPIVGVLVDAPYDPKAYDQYAGAFAVDSRRLPTPPAGSPAAGNAVVQEAPQKESKCPMFKAARIAANALKKYVPQLLLGR